MAEMLATVSPKSFIARSSVHDVKNIAVTKKAIKKAFLIQMRNQGFGMVEVIGACPTNWKLGAVDCMERIKKEVIKYFPLGTFSSPQGEK
jgi:2-oxoglutarate ferredoxin oxidoreductase subunit beta